MRNITFIADFYAEEVAGGGELANEVLIRSLEKRGLSVGRVKSQQTTVSEIAQSDDFFIVANFIGLSEECRESLIEKDYAIFEHDHKYLKTRDPSPFPNYLATEDQIINKGFYQKAKAVFCQSNVHARVVSENLLIDNVINLGCSLWSDEHLKVLRDNLNTPKKKRKVVIASNNLIKGSMQAEAFCVKIKNDYDLIQPCTFDDLIPQLAQYESLVFFSQVLETFCRLAVEARILGCKLITNGNNGCASENWFGELEGEQLLEFVIDRKQEIIDTVFSVVEGASDRSFYRREESKQTAPITVILNSYRRPYNLKRQINAIKSQTIGPKEIWLWVNDHEDNHGFDYSNLGFDRIFQNDHNWKFYGRFAAALLADTEYVTVFDDDTIPGNRWIENCLETMKSNEGILGSAGYVQTGPGAMQYEPERAGWPRKNTDTMRVDYVGHAWFFKREWLSHLWREKPATWENGEDIHFSYTAQKYGGIQTYCPPHPPEETDLHGSLFGYELGVDSKATSNNQEVSHNQFFSERDFCINTALRGGWKTVNKVEPIGDNDDLE